MDDKIVKVVFKESWETMYSNDLTQGDYGLVLSIEGIALPDGNVEVHFSLTEYDGEAPVSIGTVKDNVITVAIPDFILAKENVYKSSYNAWAWVYVTDGESGRTIRKIEFTIKRRATPTTNVPEAQQDQFLNEVRQVMAETKDIAQSVRTDADEGKFNGKDGADGEKGDKGEDGKSAYEYAVEGGFKGTEEEFTELIAQAGQVDLSGYVAKEEHEAELLKAMVKVTTEESSFHHITDSANMKVVDFGMRGITEQDTVPGNQLFDISKYVSDSQAINNGDGSITLTRYMFDGSTNRISKVLPTVVVGQTIIISATTSSKLIYFGNTVKSFNSAFEVTQEMLDGDYFGFYGIDEETTTSDNPLTISDIMVNEGTTALPVEEYVGGMPSPNPGYHQEIMNAGVTKNYFNPNANETPLGLGGATGVKDGDNFIFTTKVADGNAYCKLPQVYSLVGGKPYICSCRTVNTTGSRYPSFAFFDANTGAYLWENSAYTPSDDVDVHITIYVRGEGNINDTITVTDIQLEQNTVATSYEPYGRYKIECCVGNKNLFDKIHASDESNWTMGRTSYCYYPVYVGKGNYTTISVKHVLDTGLNFVAYIADDMTKRGIPNGACLYHGSNQSLCVQSVLVRPDDSDYIWINCNDIHAMKQYMFDILQIEISREKTSFVEPIPSFTLTSDRPLTKWDNLVKRDGVWYWDYKQLKLVVDGNANWQIYTTYNGFFAMSVLPESMGRRSGYCNQLIVADLKSGGLYGNSNNIWLGVDNKHIYALKLNNFYNDTLEDKGLANWKAHLNENPLEIYTYKDESELVPLLDEEQTLLNNLETYYGVTNVYNEQGCPLWLTYAADQELHWNQKLLEIQQAII